MITPQEIQKILSNYNLQELRIGSLGGHSALDVCRGAKKHGFESVVVAQAGRNKTYAQYFKTRDGKGCVDHVIEVDSFKDVTTADVQRQLQELNTIFIHSRYFWVYCDYEAVENTFLVPIFGTRPLVRKEERDQDKNQYYFLRKAGIPVPKQYENPADIDKLVIVKAAEASRGYERAFFFVSNPQEYREKSRQLIEKGTITEESLKTAVIEEFVVGPQINLNFFYSPLTKEVELLGTDMRRQTNIDGILRLTAEEQQQVLAHERAKYIEQGHVAVTMKESLIERALDLAERFVKVTQQEGMGIIGPFALQGAVKAGPPKEEFYIFDVSMRIPGSPGTAFTPYSGYLYGTSMSVGERIAMEIRKAQQQERLAEVLT